MIESNFNKDLEEKIDLYINGRLNQEEADELWSELIQDEYYLDYMKSVANIKHLIEQKRNTKGKKSGNRVRTMVQYAAAAAIAITIGVLGVLNYSSTTTQLGVEPLSALDLGTVRGVEDSNIESAPSEAVRNAIQMANEGQIQDAVRLLQKELEQLTDTETRSNVILTLGSIYYNAGEYELSINQFRMVQELAENQELMVEKAMWYEGNALIQLGMVDEATLTLRNAYEMDGAYSRIIKSYLDAIESSAR